MAEFIDIHTHSMEEGGKRIVNRRLGVEPAVGGICVQSVGIHPWDAEALYPTLSELLSQLEIIDCVAIGEVGLDKYCKVDFGRQMELFEAQLHIAERRKLPVVIHCVKAQQEVVKMLSAHALSDVIFHGFIGSVEQMKEIVERGWFVSFGFGALRSPKTIEALRTIPLENLFLESDTDERPIEAIYEAAAQIKNIELELLKSEIENNYNKIFR
ncbi:MAG: TatD family hydrolase [Tidjanibacter sp.]|nr:TatD family hydrolase [Tidjanibacter sp.]